MWSKMRVLAVFATGLCLANTITVLAEQGLAVWYNPSASGTYTQMTTVEDIPSQLIQLQKASACYGNQDNGAMVAGVSDELWEGGQACGRRYRVSCISGANQAPHPCNQGASVEIKVIDYCRKGCKGVINLSRAAFSQIADLDAGKVVVQYDSI